MTLEAGLVIAAIGTNVGLFFLIGFAFHGSPVARRVVICAAAFVARALAEDEDAA